MPRPLRILILGGTTEARQLAEALAGRSHVVPILSLAGRTRQPALPPIACRVGGFGGIDGLIAYLRGQSIELVIDATHPFAEQMSAHAEAACGATKVPLVRLSRAPWQQQAGDQWQEVASAAAAARALGESPRHVFLTVGRLQLAAFEAAPQHHYLIRSIEPPEPALKLPHHEIVAARGPFTLEDETRLMQQARVDVLVTKNSGGDATYAKIAAARSLCIPVILMRPPQGSDVPSFHARDAVLAYIEDMAVGSMAHQDMAHQSPPAPRGV